MYYMILQKLPWWTCSGTSRELVLYDISVMTDWLMSSHRRGSWRPFLRLSAWQRRVLQHAGKSLRSCRKDCTCGHLSPSFQRSGSWFRLGSIFSATRDDLWYESSSFWLEQHLWSHLKADIQVRSKRFPRCQILGILDPSLMETILKTTSLWM